MHEVTCNLCGSRYYKVAYKVSDPSGVAQVNQMPDDYRITEERVGGLSLRIVQCMKCGLVYVNPQESAKTLYRKYRAMEDDVYAGQEGGRRLSAGIILKRIGRYRRGGKILDIGCATGFLLDEARRQGWQAHGVELSDWAVKYAREHFNLEVSEGTVEDAHFPPGSFDAVTMIDVLEHLPDPKKTLEEIRRILRPDGIVCVSTPDIDSFISRLLGGRWWGIQQAHLYYFSKETLRSMLESAGFVVKGCAGHVRVFDRDYLSRRLGGYSRSLQRFFDALTGNSLFEGRLLKINLNDQVEVFARKKRSLFFVQEDEKGERERPRQGKNKTIAVLPAYNAVKTLAVTVRDIPRDIVDDVILVDDASGDQTVKVAEELGLKVFRHKTNKGYGANQKTCYTKALEMDADIVVMVHPDYQYDPKIIPELVRPIAEGRADAVFGSRMMKGGALEGGMPMWKHNANILLTAFENVILGTYLTEYHSGFRAYSRRYLKSVNFLANSDGFVFDTEIIVQGILQRLKIEEVPIRTRYFDEASTIRLGASLVYGMGIVWTLLKYLLHSRGIIRFKQFM